MSSKETEANSEESHTDAGLGALVNTKSVLDCFVPSSTSSRQFKRIVFYALVELHPRKTSTAVLISQLKDLLRDVNITACQIYRARRIGHRWKAIVSWASRESDEQLTGLLRTLDGTSCWERCSKSKWQAAFNALSKKSDIVRRAQDRTKDTNRIIKELKNLFAFVKPSPSKGQGQIRSQGTASGGMASGVIPDSIAAGYIDAEPLIILLSFLADCDVPVDLLCRGASRRKRWSDDGEISEANPTELGLSDDLIRIFSPRMVTKTLAKLKSAIIWKSPSRFSLSQEEREKTRKQLPGNIYPIWSLRALILTCRSVPWKYLEYEQYHHDTRITASSKHPHRETDASLLVSHIRYALEEARRYHTVKYMVPQVRLEIALSLLESSRFSLMEWRRFAVDQAKELTIGLDDSYTSSQLAQRQCLLHRLSGHLELAFDILPNSFPRQGSRRLHATYGLTIIQCALNHIQLDQLDKAIASLAEWQPKSLPPSAMEEIVFFRQCLTMGRILRYQGRFTESLQYLHVSQSIASTAQKLIFREDASDVVCNLASTYLELDNPRAGESCLRDAIERQMPNQGALTIALVECLFAQGRFEEADEELSLIVQCELKLTRMYKLHLAIVRAKLSHIQSQFVSAFRHWTEAMDILRHFPLASGRAARIILLSQCHVLHRQCLFDVENRTREQLDALEECAERSAALYWVSGLRHWLHWLERNYDVVKSHPTTFSLSDTLSA